MLCWEADKMKKSISLCYNENDIEVKNTFISRWKMTNTIASSARAQREELKIVTMQSVFPPR